MIIFIFTLSWSFPTCFALKWGSNGIFNFLNFFTVFLEFSITGHVGTKRNDNFYFLSFSAFFNLFWLGKMPWWCFLIFWNCLLFFCTFLLWVGQERNGMIIFIFSLSQSSLTYFALKWSCNGIFQFFEFFCYFNKQNTLETSENDQNTPKLIWNTLNFLNFRGILVRFVLQCWF